MAIGGAAAPAFTPADLTGIVDYGIGSGIVHTGGSITSWPGELGVVTFAQSTASRRPTRNATGSPNSNPVAVFDDVDDFLATDDASGLFTGGPFSQPSVLATVLKMDSLSTTAVMFDGITGTDQHYFAFNPSGGDKWTYGAGTFRSIVETIDTNWHDFIIDFNGASGAFERDGTELDTGDVGPDQLTGLNMGINNANNHPSGIQVAAWVFINTTISAGDRTSLRTWLSEQ